MKCRIAVPPMVKAKPAAVRMLESTGVSTWYPRRLGKPPTTGPGQSGIEGDRKHRLLLTNRFQSCPGVFLPLRQDASAGGGYA